MIKKALPLLFIIFTVFAYALNQPKILEPNEAFKIEAKLANGVIHTNIDLGEKIYLYDDKLHYKIVSPKNIDITKDLKLPKPVKFHEFIVHRKDIEVDIPLSLIKQKIPDAKKFKLQIEYQGCSEVGLCYAPLKKEFSFPLLSGISKIPSKETLATSVSGSEQDKIAGVLAGENIWFILATFFGFGLLLALTPCIFPMIPILSSIIVSQSKDKMNAKRGFFLSLIYVLSMALAYTIAGILAALFGNNLQTAMQNPWVVVIFSAVFVALAFSMFGFYEISLPASLQSKLSKRSNEAQGQGIVGVAIMGFLSALIVGPCVAPPLAGALIYIGQTGNVLLGGSALFVMSLGMGVPLLLIGIGAGKFMPKPGVWMTRVSYVFGVVMLGIAIWMLEKILPNSITMLLWGLLFLGSGVYMGALEPIGEKDGWSRLIKSIALFFLIYSIFLFIGVFTHANNPLDPLEKITSSKNSVVINSNSALKNELSFKKISTLNELENIVKNSKKPVLIDFSAKWCSACKELEHITFKDPAVVKEMKNFELYRVDVTDNTQEDKKLLKRFGLFGPPGIILFKEGKELKNLQIVGYKEPNEFLKYLKKVQESDEKW